MRKVFFVIFVMACVAIVFGKLSHKEPLVDNLLLENVEALASDEALSPIIRCIGRGDTPCPITGTKVAYVTESFR